MIQIIRMMNKNQTLNSINIFDKSYNKLNTDLNCFTNNLSEFARSYITDCNHQGKLSGKLIAVKDNINIKDYPTTSLYELTNMKINVNNVLKNIIFIYKDFLKSQKVFK